MNRLVAPVMGLAATLWLASCGSGSAAYDADNYACREGLCVYLGCRSDAECLASITAYPTVCR